MIVLFIWINLKVGNLFNLLCYYNLGIVEFLWCYIFKMCNGCKL